MGGTLLTHWLASVGALTAWAAGGRIVPASEGAGPWLDCLQLAWTFCAIYKHSLLSVSEEHN